MKRIFTMTILIFFVVAAPSFADLPLPAEPQGPGPQAFQLVPVLLGIAYAWWVKVLS